MNRLSRTKNKKSVRRTFEDWFPLLKGLLGRTPPVAGDKGPLLRPHIFYYAFLAFITLVIYLLIRPQTAQDLGGFKLGLPSPRVITAPLSFDFVDQLATQRKMDETVKRLPPSYNYVPENLVQMRDRIRRLAEIAKTTAQVENQPLEEWAIAVMDQAEVHLENHVYRENLSPEDKLPATTYDCLAYYKSYDSFWNALAGNVETSAGFGVADTLEPLRESSAPTEPRSSDSPFAQGVHILDDQGNERLLTSSQEIFSPENFFTRFELKISQDFPDPQKDLVVRQFALDVARVAYVGPTLFFNREITERRRKESLDRVAPVVIHVEKNDTLIGRNDVATLQHMEKLNALREQLRVTPPAELGFLLLSVVFCFMVIRFQNIYYPKFNYNTRKIAVIFLVILLLLVLSRVYAYLTLLDLGSNRLSQAGYGLPMGAMGVMLTVLVGVRMAMFSSAITSIYAAFVLGGGGNVPPIAYLMVSVLTAWGAIYTVSRIRQRSDLYRAGGVVIILASVLILAFSLQKYQSFDQLLQHSEALKWALIWGTFNGILVLMLSIALLPILEDLIGITTDMKLLELTQKNELLQRLEQEAPGTYQHSMRVATLAESAAETIGANALLTRVGCYYHDIGKIEKPQHFIENQQSLSDRARSAQTPTNLRCFMIRNHVKIGFELAKKYNLPEVIIDFIPEHHGTTLLSFFYHEALSNPENEGKVKEEDFRYPGPKPQSKETAIVMLADSLEAASRTIDTGNEKEIHQLVHKIVNERFMDGQFNECNLTLKDLDTLRRSFSDSIMHMAHPRIPYPTLPAPRSRTGEGELDKEELLGETREQPAARTRNGESPSPDKSQDKRTAVKFG